MKTTAKKTTAKVDYLVLVNGYQVPYEGPSLSAAREAFERFRGYAHTKRVSVRRMDSGNIAEGLYFVRRT